MLVDYNTKIFIIYYFIYGIGGIISFLIIDAYCHKTYKRHAYENELIPCLIWPIYICYKFFIFSINYIFKYFESIYTNIKKAKQEKILNAKILKEQKEYIRNEVLKELKLR